eukprot:Hpha_TRINITY_DN12449_c0_g1::TRINITY_DN12449_c0_g1_i1::g.42998::m.42998
MVGRWLVLAAGLGVALAAPGDAFYDCRFRRLAMDYVDDVILGASAGWGPGAHREAARQAVADGLRLAECNASAATRPRGRAAAAAASDTTTLYIATDGNDGNDGSATAPLATIQGAQARIRQLYPPGSRPAIQVLLRAGDYYLPPRKGMLSTHRAGPVFGTFSEEDSGASADRPIVYAAEPGAEGAARLHGGTLLRNLNWSPANRTALPYVPSGTLVATLPAGISIDPQDQLFLGGAPLVRARTPNGRPWMPLDGFNLTAALDDDCPRTVPGVPRVFTSCLGKTKPRPPKPYPGPNAPAAPAAPPVGNCSAPVSGASLLYGFPSQDFWLAGEVPSASACAAACAAVNCCSGWTWHDAQQGGYALRCYFVANPLNVWSRAEPAWGHSSGLCNHGAAATDPCPGRTSPTECFPVNVTCGGKVQVDGFVGDAKLGPSVSVEECFEHLPNMGNSWPHFRAAALGRVDKDNKTYTYENMFDLTQNFPEWFGPWTGGMVVKGGQDVGTGATPLGQLRWDTAGGTVVHVMADYEWGSVQFEVSSATRLTGGDARLYFKRGGWQQARPATLSTKNRFYMEGNIEFLDAAGEWHYDPRTRALYVVPPSGVSGPAAMADLLLTQTDCLFRLEGTSSDPARRVQHIRFENLTLAHTSASFFLPHEESSGGDYAVTRSAAVFLENASFVELSGCEMQHLGGNGVFLSNSVRNVSVVRNHMSYLGTSGVLLLGRTGSALMDARDGEAMVAAAKVAGAADPNAADNGVRLPRDNVVAHNVIHDYGIWDKQSAGYHKALAPGNEFSRNAVFNCSRHAVNFQDSMGGGGVVDGNLFFSLNRETKDTSAMNSWGRRNYLFSDDTGATAATPRLIPATANSWRNNLVLGRPLGQDPQQGGPYSNANCLRCDDGASWYNMSNNVCYGSRSAMEFNGGTQVYTHENLFVQGGWTLCASPPMVGGGSHDMYVDAPAMWVGICGQDKCRPFWAWNITNQTAAGSRPARYTGDYNTIVVNSTGTEKGVTPDLSQYFCGKNLSTWQNLTKGDQHTTLINNRGAPEYAPDAVLARARKMLWKAAGM